MKNISPNIKLLYMSSVTDNTTKLNVNKWNGQICLECVKFPPYNEGQTNRPIKSLTFIIPHGMLLSFGYTVGMLGFNRTENFRNNIPYSNITEKKFTSNRQSPDATRCDGIVISSKTIDNKERVELKFCKNEESMSFVFGETISFKNEPELKLDPTDIAFTIFSTCIIKHAGIKITKNGIPETSTDTRAIIDFIYNCTKTLADMIAKRNTGGGNPSFNDNKEPDSNKEDIPF